MEGFGLNYILILSVPDSHHVLGIQYVELAFGAVSGLHSNSLYWYRFESSFLSALQSENVVFQRCKFCYFQSRLRLLPRYHCRVKYQIEKNVETPIILSKGARSISAIIIIFPLFHR
jgi:hypothetical protein